MTITLHLPQFIFVALFIIDILYVIVHHGDLKHETHYNIATTLLNAALLLGIAYWGGFFG